MPVHRGTAQIQNKGKTMKKTMLAVLAGFLAMGGAQAQTTAAASAAADTAPHAYVGLGVGVVSDPSAGGRRATAKVFGGYEFNRNWALEGGFTGFRTSDFLLWDGTQDGPVTEGHVRSRAAYVAGKYTIPINENFAAYGKLGLSHSERKVSSPQWSFTERDTGLYAGLGAQYKLTRDLSAVVEYERYGKRKTFGPKADVYSVGLKYGF
jgi:OOP family OmpA-OmpF porin